MVFTFAAGLVRSWRSNYFRLFIITPNCVSVSVSMTLCVCVRMRIISRVLESQKNVRHNRQTRAGAGRLLRMLLLLLC